MWKRASERKAYTEGYQHANDGGRIMDNPYDTDELMPTRESDAWEDGFNRAMDEDDPEGRMISA